MLSPSPPIDDENERRRHGDRPFDVQPVRSATVVDLNRRFFEAEYRPSAIAPDILAQNDRTFEQRLAVTKMVLTAEEAIPTTPGILVLGITPRDFIPGAYIQFLRIAGRELGDPIADEQVIDGLVSDVLRRVDDKLAAHNRTAVEFTSGPVESRPPRQAQPRRSFTAA